MSSWSFPSHWDKQVSWCSCVKILSTPLQQNGSNFFGSGPHTFEPSPSFYVCWKKKLWRVIFTTLTNHNDTQISYFKYEDGRNEENCYKKFIHFSDSKVKVKLKWKIICHKHFIEFHVDPWSVFKARGCGQYFWHFLFPETKKFLQPRVCKCLLTISMIHDFFCLIQSNFG